MKVLLDENLPHELRLDLAGHDVFTIQYLGWEGTKNGHLLLRAAEAGFDVLITIDQAMVTQQNVGALPVAVVILTAPSNAIVHLRPLVPEIQRTLGSLKPRMIHRVG